MSPHVRRVRSKLHPARRVIEDGIARRKLRPMDVGYRPYVRGRPIIRVNDAVAGDHFRVYSEEATTLLTGPGCLRIHDDVFLNSGVRLECFSEITIHTGCLISFGVTITDTDSHGLGGKPIREAPVKIGEGSWIGLRSIILPGVTIGRRVMIAAGSVVTRDVPDDALVAGVPAKVIRLIDYPPGQSRAYTMAT
jgi:acetyltransferase-like isoleucine patch superfamily enzyme